MSQQHAMNIDGLDAAARRAWVMRPVLAVLLAFGLTGLLFSTGAVVGALRGSDVAGWQFVLLVLSLSLVVGGTFAFRWMLRQLRYRITKPFSLRKFAMMWAGFAVVIALSVLIARVLEIKGGELLVAGLPLVLVWYLRSRSAVILDWNGANLGGTCLPWRAIAQVAVQDSGPEVEIGTRVRRDVPLPEGTELPPPDPADPTGPRLRTTVAADKLDLAHLTTSVRRFSRNQVSVVERSTAGDKVLGV